MGRQRLSGGFWRRFTAGLIDFILIMAAFQVVALGAYALSDGRIRMGSNFIHLSGQCNYNRVADSQVTGTLTCSKTFFGWEYNRTKRIDYKTGASKTYAVDRSEAPMDAIDISPFKGAVLILILALFEAGIAATPGKLLLGLRVTGSAGSSVGLPQSLWRNTLIWGGFALLYPINLLDDWLSSFSSWATWAALGLAMLLWIIPLISLIFSRPHPFYDNASATHIRQR